MPDEGNAAAHLRGILDMLGPCERLDHHGNCQSHFAESPCRVGEARKWLESRSAPAGGRIPVRESVGVAGRVEAPDHGAADAHVWFSAAVTQALLSRIRELSKAVKALKAVTVTEFEGSCRVFDAAAGAQADYGLTTDEEDWDGQSAAQAATEQRCDAMELVVTGDSFHWTWLPRHASDAARCNTPAIGIRDLERAFSEPNKRNKEG